MAPGMGTMKVTFQSVKVATVFPKKSPFLKSCFTVSLNKLKIWIHPNSNEETKRDIGSPAYLLDFQ